jgi:hypothetical protein
MQGKQLNKQSLAPCTIKQLKNAPASGGDNGFSVDGKDLHQVTIVGLITHADEQNTNLQYTIDDGTDSINVKMWIDAATDEAAIEKRAQWRCALARRPQQLPPHRHPATVWSRRRSQGGCRRAGHRSDAGVQPGEVDRRLPHPALDRLQRVHLPLHRGRTHALAQHQGRCGERPAASTPHALHTPRAPHPTRSTPHALHTPRAPHPTLPHTCAPHPGPPAARLQHGSNALPHTA